MSDAAPKNYNKFNRGEAPLITMAKPRIEIKQWGCWRIAWVSKGNFSQCCDLLTACEIDGFGISRHHGSDFSDLREFLGVSQLRSLVMPFSAGFNLDHLNDMPQLRHLVVAEGVRSIDISNLINLEDLTLDMSNHVSFPSSSDNLKKLKLGNFKSLHNGLGAVSQFSNLVELELVKGDLRTLDGISELAHLHSLDLHYMKKLESLEPISDTAVAKFTVSHCKKVKDLNTVAKCRALRVLRYHDSAALSSIGFIGECPKLIEFRFVGVDVEDGDMTPLIGLEAFAFTQKRHFSHTEKELKKLQLAGRGRH